MMDKVIPGLLREDLVLYSLKFLRTDIEDLWRRAARGPQPDLPGSDPDLETKLTAACVKAQALKLAADSHNTETVVDLVRLVALAFQWNAGAKIRESLNIVRFVNDVLCVMRLYGERSDDVTHSKRTAAGIETLWDCLQNLLVMISTQHENISHEFDAEMEQLCVRFTAGLTATLAAKTKNQLMLNRKKQFQIFTEKIFSKILISNDLLVRRAQQGIICQDDMCVFEDAMCTMFAQLLFSEAKDLDEVSALQYVRKLSQSEPQGSTSKGQKEAPKASYYMLYYTAIGDAGHSLASMVAGDHSMGFCADSAAKVLTVFAEASARQCDLLSSGQSSNKSSHQDSGASMRKHFGRVLHMCFQLISVLEHRACREDDSGSLMWFLNARNRLLSVLRTSLPGAIPTHASLDVYRDNLSSLAASIIQRYDTTFSEKIKDDASRLNIRDKKDDTMGHLAAAELECLHIIIHIDHRAILGKGILQLARDRSAHGPRAKRSADGKKKVYDFEQMDDLPCIMTLSCVTNAWMAVDNGMDQCDKSWQNEDRNAAGCVMQWQIKVLGDLIQIYSDLRRLGSLVQSVVYITRTKDAASRQPQTKSTVVDELTKLLDEKSIQPLLSKLFGELSANQLQTIWTSLLPRKPTKSLAPSQKKKQKTSDGDSGKEKEKEEEESTAAEYIDPDGSLVSGPIGAIVGALRGALITQTSMISTSSVDLHTVSHILTDVHFTISQREQESDAAQIPKTICAYGIASSLGDILVPQLQVICAPEHENSLASKESNELLLRCLECSADVLQLLMSNHFANPSINSSKQSSEDCFAASSAVMSLAALFLNCAANGITSRGKAREYLDAASDRLSECLRSAVIGLLSMAEQHQELSPKTFVHLIGKVAVWEHISNDRNIQTGLSKLLGDSIWTITRGSDHEDAFTDESDTCKENVLRILNSSIVIDVVSVNSIARRSVVGVLTDTVEAMEASRKASKSKKNKLKKDGGESLRAFMALQHLPLEQLIESAKASAECTTELRTICEKAADLVCLLVSASCEHTGAVATGCDLLRLCLVTLWRLDDHSYSARKMTEVFIDIFESRYVSNCSVQRLLHTSCDIILQYGASQTDDSIGKAVFSVLDIIRDELENLKSDESRGTSDMSMTHLAFLHRISSFCSALDKTAPIGNVLQGKLTSIQALLVEHVTTDIESKGRLCFALAEVARAIAQLRKLEGLAFPCVPVIIPNLHRAKCGKTGGGSVSGWMYLTGITLSLFASERRVADISTAMKLADTLGDLFSIIMCTNEDTAAEGIANDSDEDFSPTIFECFSLFLRGLLAILPPDHATHLLGKICSECLQMAADSEGTATGQEYAMTMLECLLHAYSRRETTAEAAKLLLQTCSSSMGRLSTALSYRTGLQGIKDVDASTCLNNQSDGDIGTRNAVTLLDVYVRGFTAIELRQRHRAGGGRDAVSMWTARCLDTLTKVTSLMSSQWAGMDTCIPFNYDGLASILNGILNATHVVLSQQRCEALSGSVGVISAIMRQTLLLVVKLDRECNNADADLSGALNGTDDTGHLRGVHMDRQAFQQTTLPNLLRACSRTFATAASNAELLRHAPLLVASLVDILAKVSPSSLSQEIISPGLFALMDKCREKQRKQIFGVLDTKGRIVLQDLYASYNRDFKFIGKS